MPPSRPYRLGPYPPWGRAPRPRPSSRIPLPPVEHISYPDTDEEPSSPDQISKGAARIKVADEVDSDEEEALLEVERDLDNKAKRSTTIPRPGLKMKKEESGEETLVNVVQEKGGAKSVVLKRGEVKEQKDEATLVKVKSEDDEKVKKEELDEPARVPAMGKDPRYDEDARLLRVRLRTEGKFNDRSLAEDIIKLEERIKSDRGELPRNKHALKEGEVREWYLSPLLYRIVNEGYDLASDPINMEDWNTLRTDLDNLRRPLQKEELRGYFRQLDKLTTAELSFKTRKAVHEAKFRIFILSEISHIGRKWVENPSSDEQWAMFDEFLDARKLYSSELLRAVTKEVGVKVTTPRSRDGESAWQLHKEPSSRPAGRKRRSASPTFLPASTTSTPSTMSNTAPQNPIDLTSPITSPNPKRTKTAHNSDSGKMIPATTSEPNNVPVPVTKVQDGPHLLIKKLSQKAKLPTRGSAFAAGYDLYAAKETVIPARGKGLVDTDISMAVPAGTYGRIAPRSGLAAKNFIDTGAGVIDADYRGQVKVLLFNHSDVDFVVKEHDRVAQLILERIYTPEVMEVQELEESVRGEGGFGSTGVSIA